MGGGLELTVEARGRWMDPETFAADLIFVHTPHRMTVTFRPRTGSSAARWCSVPLGYSSLASLTLPVTADREHHR
jgi:hypothetical protein